MFVLKYELDGLTCCRVCNGDLNESLSVNKHMQDWEFDMIQEAGIRSDCSCCIDSTDTRVKFLGLEEYKHTDV